jgi:hypothetical protein
VILRNEVQRNETQRLTNETQRMTKETPRPISQPSVQIPRPNKSPWTLFASPACLLDLLISHPHLLHSIIQYLSPLAATSLSQTCKPVLHFIRAHTAFTQNNAISPLYRLPTELIQEVVAYLSPVGIYCLGKAGKRTAYLLERRERPCWWCSYIYSGLPREYVELWVTFISGACALCGKRDLWKAEEYCVAFKEEYRRWSRRDWFMREFGEGGRLVDLVEEVD